MIDEKDRELAREWEHRGHQKGDLAQLLVRVRLEAQLEEHKLIQHEKCSDENPCSRRKWLQRELAALRAAARKA